MNLGSYIHSAEFHFARFAFSTRTWDIHWNCNGFISGLDLRPCEVLSASSLQIR